MTELDLKELSVSECYPMHMLAALEELKKESDPAVVVGLDMAIDIINENIFFFEQ